MSEQAENDAPSDGLLKKTRGPIIVYVACLIIYGAVMWDRLAEHSRDNHYVYLAEAMLDGRFHIEGKPPHRNDWARYEGEWYVSFPPLPAFLMMPGVAIWGLDFNDRLFTLFFAAAAPALLFLLLQAIAAGGRLSRSRRELWMLAVLYAIGTVYFFCAVQGSVWFTAHIVGSVMLLLFMNLSLGGRHPALAGLFLALAFACRPPLAMALPFFVYEALRPHSDGEASGILRWTIGALRKAGPGPLLRKALLFVAPAVAVLAGLAIMNQVRFGDPTEFGHGHLKVIQSARIAKWGLFHYHYLARNLGIVLTSMPWLSAQAPHIKVSMHGLALWVTTPAFLWLLWPRALTREYAWLALTLLCLALPSLLYQNSGWVQFGQRFSVDYAPVMILMLAVGGRPFRKLFTAALVFAVVVNLFGAITFDRHWEYYAGGKNRDRIYQPN